MVKSISECCSWALVSCSLVILENLKEQLNLKGLLYLVWCYRTIKRFERGSRNSQKFVSGHASLVTILKK